MDKQKGIAGVLIILLILIAIGVGAYLVQQKTNLLPLAFLPKQEEATRSLPVRQPQNQAAVATPTPTVEVINNKEDLTKVLKEVDDLSTDVIDSQLSSSELDTSSL